MGALQGAKISALSKLKSEVGIDDKIKKALDIADGLIEAGEKVVIFSEFHDHIDRLSKALDNAKIGYVKYTGKENSQQRSENITKFKTDEKCKVFIGTSAAFTGINLQEAKSVI